MWVVPDEVSLPCKVAVQILVASLQLIFGLLGTDPHTQSKIIASLPVLPCLLFSTRKQQL